MANLTEVYTGSLQVGSGVIPPVSSATFEPSLDPSKPFSIHNLGIHQGEGVQNQLGLYNGLGVWNELGVYNGIGQGIFLGGHTDAQPSYDSSAPTINYNSPDGDLNGFWKYNGSVICTAPCSDINAKKNISPIETPLKKVLQLNGVSFDWNEEIVPNMASSQGRQIGLIAQEVEKIVPEVVTTEVVENKQLKSVNYEVLTSILIESIKEQQSQIEDLTRTVQELSQKLESSCQSC